MNRASKYWIWLRFDGRYGSKSSEIASAKDFFLSQFSELVGETDLSDTAIQQQLFERFRGEKLPDNYRPTNAELCLRCVISFFIKQVCIQLEVRFGEDRGFSRFDLFPFVLNDVDLKISVKQNQRYAPLSGKILGTFNPARGNLSSWTNKLVKQERSLNVFLLEQGVYLISDWAILNDTNTQQLTRIFTEFHHLSHGEVERASTLLDSYHQVYRRDRLEKRQAGTHSKCPLPTSQQLAEIASYFQPQTKITLSGEEVMQELQTLAELLREYRIFVRRGSISTQSLDDPEVNIKADTLETNSSESVQEEFLTFYHEQLIDCLDQAIEKAIGDRHSQLQNKKPPK